MRKCRKQNMKRKANENIFKKLKEKRKRLRKENIAEQKKKKILQKKIEER